MISNDLGTYGLGLGPHMPPHLKMYYPQGVYPLHDSVALAYKVFRMLRRKLFQLLQGLHFLKLSQRTMFLSNFNRRIIVSFATWLVQFWKVIIKGISWNGKRHEAKKVLIKFSLSVPWRNVGRCRGIDPLILNLGTWWRWLVNITPQLLYSKKNPGTHRTAGTVGPRVGLGVSEKETRLLTLTGIQACSQRRCWFTLVSHTWTCRVDCARLLASTCITARNCRYTTASLLGVTERYEDAGS
jgi:hypothetical protein